MQPFIYNVENVENGFKMSIQCLLQGICLVFCWDFLIIVNSNNNNIGIVNVILFFK